MSTFSGTIHTTVPRYGFWMPGCQLWAYNERSESFPNLNLPPHLLPLSPTLTPPSSPLCGCCSEPEPDPAPPPVLTRFIRALSLLAPPPTQTPTLEQMRRFRRVHTTTSLSGCLGGAGEERRLLSHAAQTPPSPPGSFFCPHPPPPGEGMDSPLSRATGNRVRLPRQGGAQGRRAKA